MDIRDFDMQKMLRLVFSVALAALGHYFCHLRLPPTRRNYSFGEGGTSYIRRALVFDAKLFRGVYKMYPMPFKKLCHIEKKGHLKETRYITVEEQVAIILISLGQGQHYNVTRERFARSAWTMTTHFNNVLNAILALSKDYVKAPTYSLHSKIGDDDRFFPYFKDCVGALDAHIMGKDQIRFWNRKGKVTQNVLMICNFDMEFTYVLVGWEGSANDSTILKTTITTQSKSQKLKVPQGKYLLVDAGFANLPGFLAPYHRTRYHLSEFDPNPPQNAEELFNLRLSSLRTTIDRTFGV